MEKSTDEQTMKKQRSLPIDRISELPSSISQIILMFLPMRDMVMLDSEVSISSCPFLESLRLSSNSSSCFSVDAPKLKLLLFRCYDSSRISYINTPLLEDLSLHIGYGQDTKVDPVKFFRSVPLLKHLNVHIEFVKFCDAGGSSNVVPTIPNNLKTLVVDGVSSKSDEISATFWLIKNFPNIQKLKITLVSNSKLNLKMQEISNYSLPKLQELEIVIYYAWSSLRMFIEFIMFLLDITPELKTLYIITEPWSCKGTTDERGYKALVELACYPRASPKAKIVYVGLDLTE